MMVEGTRAVSSFEHGRKSLLTSDFGEKYNELEMTPPEEPTAPARR